MAKTVLERVIEYMVRNSEGGIYKGNIRKYMEQIGGSGGSLYNKMYEMGFEKVGKGPKAEWKIPDAILREFRK